MKKIFLLFVFILSSFFVSADNFVLNFNEVDIRKFIEWVGEFVNENYVIDPSVKGNLTIYSNKPVPSDQIDKIFKTVLSLYGFTVVKKGDISLIVPAVDGKLRTGV
ncbi:MAG TPA: hypothetical protein P5150_04945, partial [Candidatus Ratteibacteria bacterium]|nr:hypothetical protein [Candidatus Ratteibacteria bacterium]